MRQILSISLPDTQIKELKKRAKKRGFVSVSSYVHTLIKSDEHVITEKELLKIVKQGQKEYRQGKTIKAKSIADLL